MGLQIEEVIQMMNRISRMAVMENASLTEKMLVYYSQLLRYQASFFGQGVPVIKELELVEKYYLLVALQHRQPTSWQVVDKQELELYYVPHYVLINCMEYLFTLLQVPPSEIVCRLELTQASNQLVLCMTWQESITYVAEVLQQAEPFPWEAYFGEASVTWQVTENQLALYFLDRKDGRKDEKMA